MLYVALDNIRSLYNVGSIFRSADGFMVDKLFLCGYTGTPPRDEISKTALGAEEVVPFEKVSSVLELIEKCKKENFTIVCLEKNEQSRDLSKYRWGEKTLLIIGNEIEGISKEVLKEADDIVHIFMGGIKESYNVSNALTVALYDQHTKK